MQKQSPMMGACSIAWFKLAQLVSHGEKEKALGLYKLMSYSLNDKAFALQIEADLLFAFEDEGAMEKYQQAAFLYKKEQNIVLAASIYEHLRTVNPQEPSYLTTLVEIYARMDWPEKMEERFNTMIEYYQSNKMTEDQVLKAVKNIKDLCATENKDDLLEKFLNLVKVKTPNLSNQVN